MSDIDDAERFSRLVHWLIDNGLLNFYPQCRRPDGTFGKAWVLSSPYVIDGGKVDGWSAVSAGDAIDNAIGRKPSAPNDPSATPPDPT